MKRIIPIILLLIAVNGWAAEKAIVCGYNDFKDYQTAWQTISKTHGAGFNHLIVYMNTTDEIVPQGSFSSFITISHWYGMKVSMMLEVGTDPSCIAGMQNPECAPAIASKAVRYLQKYPVDALNLDYVRTVNYCMTDFCVQDYAQRYGRNLIADYDMTDSPVADYNGKAVKTVIKSIVDAVRGIRPNLEISADTGTIPYFERNGGLPADWLAAGLVDHVYLMEYDDVIPIKEITDKNLNNTDFTIMVGNFYQVKDAYYSRDPKHVDALIKSVEGIGSGVGVYSYEFMR